MTQGRTRLVRGMAMFVVAGLSAASCGGGGSTKGAGTTVPSPGRSTSPGAATTVPASTTTPPTTDHAKYVMAAAAVPQPADFPPAFMAQPEDPQGGLQIELLWQDLAGCLGVGTITPPPTQATSPTFLQGLATQARATVAYTTESSATAIATAFAGPMFQGCATKAFDANAKRSAPQGAAPGPATVGPLNVPPVGQKMYAYRINIPQHLGDLTITIFQDFYVVVNGGTVSRLWFLNPGSPFPPTLEQTLVQKVVTRAA